MALIVIRVYQKGLRAGTARNALAPLISKRFPNAALEFRAEKPAPTSRSERFSVAQGDVSNAKGEAEELRDELESWKDNLPENLQGGSKASELEDAISALDEFIDACNTAEDVDVSFPGRY